MDLSPLFPVAQTMGATNFDYAYVGQQQGLEDVKYCCSPQTFQLLEFM